MVFDTHCHIQFPQYDLDREEVLKRAKAQDMGLICVGTDLESSQKAIELTSRYEGIWASVGLHPNDTNLQFSISDFQKLMGYPKVVAVGEVGLDYYRTKDLEKQKLQREVFEQFIELAGSNNKPLIIHCRDPLRPSESEASAHSDLIKTLSSYKLAAKSSKLSGIIHSFTGTLEEANKYIGLGFHIGLNGIITFANQYDDIVKNIPLERILLETDSPYLSPIPHRGKRNEPSFIVETVKKIAELRSISQDEVKTTSLKSTQELFRL